MITFSHVWQYLAKFFLQSEMFWTNVVEKIKTRFIVFNNFLLENRAVYEIRSKNVV